MDQPPSARSSFSGRPIRTLPLMPSSVPISLKPVTPAFQSETPTNLRKDKRYLNNSSVLPPPEFSDSHLPTHLLLPVWS